MHHSSDCDERIFADALALAAGERSRFLDAACGGDAALRQRIEALLEADESAKGFMESRPQALPREADLASSPLSPSAEITEPQIGRYRILQKIGEGGCGVVYLAEQEEPVRRRVALKVIKLGMDTKAVIARFEAERQALAMMDHPGIARVLDAGATGTGRPYFVMELVRGIKITDYCDQHHLTTAQRLELFIQVCLAVQHAHQRGIIHRDLKPSNIFVCRQDDRPVPKVIDFGIAKATQGRLTDRTLFTPFEQFIGTPAYMSPEQAELSGREVDARSDLYSLGVLLYELLTGRPPFDPQIFRQAGIDEIRRLIREVEPPKPSARFNSLSAADRARVAKQRGTDAPQLLILLGGDLDWIVMKALDKNSTRRYATASDLAADLSHHLHFEPVSARPPSPAYRLQKLVRRNRLAFAAAAVTAALVLGLGLATWSFLQEKAGRKLARAAEIAQSRARAEAEAEKGKVELAAAKSDQAFKFIAGMMKGAAPGAGAGWDPGLLRETLDRTVGRLDTILPDQPEMESNLCFILGTVYVDLGDYAKAEAMARLALVKAEQHFGRDHGAVAGALVLLGQIGQLQGQGTDSEPGLREALAIARKHPGTQNENLAEALTALGDSLLGQGQLPEAETHCREALALVKQHPDIEYLPPDRVQQILAAILQKEGRPAEAEPLFNEALAARKNRASLGQDHPIVVFARLGLSPLLMMQGKRPEAEAQFGEALAILRKSRSHEYPAIIMVLSNLAYLAHQSGQLPEAEVQYREVLALQRKAFGPEHPATRRTESLLALVLQQQHKPAEVETRPDATATPRNQPAKP